MWLTLTPDIFDYFYMQSLPKQDRYRLAQIFSCYLLLYIPHQVINFEKDEPCNSDQPPKRVKPIESTS